MEGNGWHEYKRKVIDKMNRVDSLDDKVEQLLVTVARLDSKMNIFWALLLTAVTAGTAAFVTAFF